MRPRLRANNAAQSRDSSRVSTAPYLLSLGSRATASMPAASSARRISSRPLLAKWSGKNPRLPTMTPIVIALSRTDIWFPSRCGPKTNPRDRTATAMIPPHVGVQFRMQGRRPGDRLNPTRLGPDSEGDVHEPDARSTFSPQGSAFAESTAIIHTKVVNVYFVSPVWLQSFPPPGKPAELGAALGGCSSDQRLGKDRPGAYNIYESALEAPGCLERISGGVFGHGFPREAGSGPRGRAGSGRASRVTSHRCQSPYFPTEPPPGE